MFELSKWITANASSGWGYPEKIEQFPVSPYIAKSFNIIKPVKKAELNIVGYGQAAYYINGARIQDSFLPTQPSNPQTAVIYNTYLVTNMLRNGNNRLGIILGNIGVNDLNINRWRFEPKLIAQLDILYDDGTSETLSSNSSWKTAPSPTLFSMRKCGEKFDARLIIPGWCNADFDDSSWTNVSICKGPGGTFRTSVCPPVRIKEEIAGIEIAPGLFDFGKITSGWVRINISGKIGSEITIKYSERITADSRHADQNGMITVYEPMAHKDRYILGSSKLQKWEQLFSYHGFRYAEVIGDYDSVSATAVVAFTDIEQKSDFITDNETLNAIHSATINSIRTNCHGALTDCPTREQNEWTGDGMLSAESTSICFNAYNMFFEWMNKFREDQFPNGALPCIIPAKNWLWESNFASGTDWDSAIIHIPYYSFKYSGNPEIVNKNWENMCRSLEYFKSLSETNLMCNGVGDWCSLTPMCDREITDTAYYRTDLIMMSEIAEAIGKEKTEFLNTAKAVKEDFRKKYITNGRLNSDNETAITAALWSKIYTSDEAALEAKRLNDIISDNGFRFSGGVHELRMIFDVLSDYGYNQTLFNAIVNEKYPGYGYCIKKGLTTLPERFDFESFLGDTDSLNHHFRSPVISWFYKSLAGININGFGFDNITIAPQFVKGITELKAEMKGIRVSYDEKQIKLSSPYPFKFIYNGKASKLKPGEYIFEK